MTVRKSVRRATGTKSEPTRQYTQPELRERIKAKVLAGDKGGAPGQWSARKAQLVATEYKHHGGGYRGTERSPKAKNLLRWTREHQPPRDQR